MKPFRTHLQERDYGGFPPDMTPCQILSQRNPPLPKADRPASILVLANNPGWTPLTKVFVKTLRQWIVGTRDANEHYEISKTLFTIIDGCPTRAGWTKYTGKVYRGLSRLDAEMKANFKFERVATVQIRNAPTLCAIGTYTYNPKRMAQSWARNINSAMDFAPGGMYGGSSSLIIEKDIRADGVVLDYLGGHRSESEVILRNKSNEKLRCYVILHEPGNTKRFMSDFVWSLLPPEVQKLKSN